MATRPDRRKDAPAPSHGRGLWVGIPVALLTLGLALATVHWLRTREATAGMLAAKPAPIDGQRAYKYMKQLCDIGPRPAGSAANAKQRALVAKHFEKAGLKVREQPFDGVDPKSGARVDMVNLIGGWHPERRDRVVLGAHYDTRPFPDEDPNPAKRRALFVGANDGASGVAVLMEVANHLADSPCPWGIDLVLFDGEELVYGGGRQQTGDYFLGSHEFAKQYAQGVDDRTIPYHYVAGLVLDMVGGRDVSIDQEQNSLNFAPGLVREVWAVARQLNARGFRQRVGMAVQDDHLPLNDAGIPTIDLIEFPYRYWHTSEDVPEHCSAASLEQVGKVVTAWLALPRRQRR